MKEEIRMQQPKINEKDKLTLKDFDLTSNEVDQILRTAQLMYRSSTPNDPPTRAGMDAYFAVVRALREALVPKGWENAMKVIKPKFLTAKKECAY